MSTSVTQVTVQSRVQRGAVTWSWVKKVASVETQSHSYVLLFKKVQEGEVSVFNSSDFLVILSI